MRAEGQAAPEFTLPDQNGDDVSLSDLRGQTVVLYFYPRADTQGSKDTKRGYGVATALANGMPRWKYLANRILTAIENRVLGTALSEAHTGYRAYSRRLLLTVPFLRNAIGFSFDTELILQAAQFEMRTEEVPAACRYFRDASSVGFASSVVYGIKTIWACLRLELHRAHVLSSRKFKDPGKGTD